MPFATAALLGLLSFWQTPEVACVAQGGEFVYPVLAKYARIEGLVAVHVEVGEAGSIVQADYDGHPMLAAQVAKTISTIQFPASCSGQEIDLRIQFKLGEAAEIRSTGPNGWLVQAVAPVIETDHRTSTLGRQPWWKRIFHR
jgi:Gram-negative bacterial TonB protein C-terminal